jgi:hypothetical protein
MTEINELLLFTEIIAVYSRCLLPFMELDRSLLRSQGPPLISYLNIKYANLFFFCKILIT